MAKKIKGYDNGHICDDCKHCEWHTQYWNLDPLGQPITFGCKQGVFEHGEIREKRACKEWEHKQRNAAKRAASGFRWVGAHSEGICLATSGNAAYHTNKTKN